MTQGHEQIKIVYKHGKLCCEMALGRICAVLARHRMPTSGFRLNDENIDLSMAATRVCNPKRNAFDLVGSNFAFLLGSVNNYHLDFLEITSLKVTSVNWDDWADEFVYDPNFVLAWIIDCEYDHWQNAQDPLEYEAAKRAYSHLQMKSNGLPYPVERKVIDTSGNPGRWKFHHGYIEAVGSTMWLGPTFWSLTGALEKDVDEARRFDTSHPAPGVTKIRASETPFTRAEDGSGESQSVLRAMLFPRKHAPSK